MAEVSAFRNSLLFLDKIGIYDVLLPFLLVFTIMFAILEKTKVLGIEKINGQEYTKKNLNSIVAFVMALLVVASTQIVSIINEVLANVVLLLILAICFLMLVGVFFKDKEFSLEEFPGWIKFFMVIMFIGIVVIFLNALDWLQYIFGLFVHWEAEWASSILFVLIIISFIWFITHEPNRGGKKESKKE